MRVPLEWLSEYCDPGWDPEELGERLALTGTEVERVSTVGAPSAEGFVLGLVKDVSKHPDADRLSVCEVDTGDGERTIVCGAPNVAAGQLVPVALPGAVLPDGTKLKKAKLRGVESDGMILSETELELGDDSDGIIVLAEGDELNGAKPGAALEEVVPLSQAVLELEVTTNRSDCLAVYGVAREVHAVTGADLSDPPWEQDAETEGEGKAEDYASVKVEVPDLCPRFTARVFTDVTIGPSPLWLKARLMAAGQRPINNVVDITNYVMLMTGQPLHAFDLDEVPGGELIIRTAKPGERMTTLDGVERELDPEVVLVCDREKPSGIAGVMGGQTSEVSEKTTRVLLEVATWNGVNILRTSRKLALRSEASARFEKQLHPALTMRAQHVASRLLVELAGAKLVPGTIDESVGEPEPRKVDAPGAAGRGADRDADRRRHLRRPPRRPGLRRQAQADKGARRGDRRDRPARARRRCAARGRPDRGGGAARRPRQEPSEHPPRRRNGGRPHPRADAAAAGRGRDARPGRATRSSAGALRTPGSAIACGFPPTIPGGT